MTCVVGPASVISCRGDRGYRIHRFGGVEEVDPIPSNWLRQPARFPELVAAVAKFWEAASRHRRVLIHCVRGAARARD